MAIIVVVGLKQRKESELELSQNWRSSRTNEVISPASGSIVLQRNSADGMPRWYPGGDKGQDCKQLISS